jgi:hypothetical protein
MTGANFLVTERALAHKMETIVSLICSASSGFKVFQELSHYSSICNKHHHGEETGRSCIMWNLEG